MSNQTERSRMAEQFGEQPGSAGCRSTRAAETGPEFTTKSEWIYARLKSDIARGVLAPGERLVASAIAGAHGISPSPVRDALNRLCQEGFVDITPHAGASVVSLDVGQLREMIFIRMELESVAAGLAVPRMTREIYARLDGLHQQMRDCVAKDDRLTYETLNWAFHDCVYACCGNATLYGMVMSLWRKSGISRTVFVRLPAQLEHSYQEHQRWLDTARSGDAEGVRRIVRGHLQHTLERIEQIVGSSFIPSAGAAGG